MGHRVTTGGDRGRRGAAIRMARAAVRAAVPLAARAGARASHRGGAAELVRRVGSRLVDLPAERHPLAPAAVRLERSRSVRRGRHAEQVAVTVWFGDGPALPVPGGPGAGRTALRVGASLLGAVALAAASAAAVRIAAEDPQRLEAPREPRRLARPAG